MAEKNWVEALSNPQGQLVRKFLRDVLGDRLGNHLDIVERLSKSLATRGDLEAFGKLILEVYETGYMKSLNEYQSTFNKMGYKINIKPQEQTGSSAPIFPNTTESRDSSQLTVVKNTPVKSCVFKPKNQGLHQKPRNS